MRRRKALRLAGFAFALILIVVIITSSLMLTRAHALAIVHPRRAPVMTTPADLGVENWRDAEFQTTSGLTLRGWYMPPAQLAPTVILLHGHGGNRVNSRIVWYVQRGYGVLTFDFRGHGESDGDLTTLGYFERDDVIAAYNWLLQQPEADAARVLLHGESMGAAAMILAAPELPAVSGFIVESTFSSLQENIEQGVRTATGLPSFPFAPLILFWGEREAGASIAKLRPVDVIGEIAPRPLLIMHGELDPLIAVENAQRLYAAAGDPKTLVLFPTAVHVGLIENDPALWDASVSAFLEQVFGV